MRYRPALEALEGRALPSAAGALDPSFGTAGLVTTDLTGTAAAANAVAVQGNGKVVTAGTAHAGSFCSPAGATARTASGTAVVCRTSPTDDSDRWRTPA